MINTEDTMISYEHEESNKLEMNFQYYLRCTETTVSELKKSMSDTDKNKEDTYLSSTTIDKLSGSLLY